MISDCLPPRAKTNNIPIFMHDKLHLFLKKESSRIKSHDICYQYTAASGPKLHQKSIF